MTNLAAYRSRKTLGNLASYTEEELDDLWDQSIVEDYGSFRRGIEPTFVVEDETQLWTSGWPALLKEILRPEQLTSWQAKVLTSWSTVPPESRSRPDRALRILRSHRPGSDDGYAEGHRADPRFPRDGAGEPAD